MQTETLETQITDIEEKLAGIDCRTSENVAAVATAEARIEKAKRRLVELTAEKEAARGDRQKALVDGKDAKVISRRLKGIQDVMEDLEDEIAGLGARLGELRAQGTQLRAERAATARLIPMAKYRDDARCYNATMEQVAPVLERMWRLCAELGEPREGKVVQFPCGILASIPRAFVMGDPESIDVGDPEKHYIFDGPGMKEKRSARVRPLMITEEVAS